MITDSKAFLNYIPAFPATIRLTGSLLIILGGILIAPLLLAVGMGESLEILAFSFTSAGALAIGFFLRWIFKNRGRDGVRPILLCTGVWLVFSLVGAIPFIISRNVCLLDACFETMSGFTTTGITMFNGLDSWPKSLLFWRALTEWIGGLGILTFFLGLSFRGTGDHRIFGAESHKINLGRPVPGLAHTLKILWGIYLLLTGLVALGLFWAGMSLFDSLCHSLTTLSTGGFSTHDASISYWGQNELGHFQIIEYILIFGMIAGGTNFFIHYRLLKGNLRDLRHNTETKYYFGYILIFFALILGERLIRGIPGGISNLENSGRTILFQVSSILTTTGFATEDISGGFFGPLAQQLFILMMVIGGCVGSTAGGFKVLRTAILSRELRREMFNVRRSRHAVTPILIDGKVIPVPEIRRVGALFFAWIGLLLLGGMITTIFSGMGGMPALSGMASALGNIGPCFIPQQQMMSLHPIIKITYILGMLAGRLEILPVLLFFNPRSWQ